MTLNPKQVRDIVKDRSSYLSFNHQLLDIFENNLTKYVEADLAAQLSPQSFAQVKHRISPINVLPRVIDKLTNIYQTTVTREVINGSKNDETTLSYYIKEMQVNAQMNSGNEMFNLCNSCLLYPFVKNKKPTLSVIENDMFVAYSDDPTSSDPTDIIVIAGRDPEKPDVVIYWVWSAESFFVSDSNGDLRPDQMTKWKNPDGINPIQRLPFIYVNSSKRKVMPKQDEDMMRIIKLIPVMLSDLNMAAMFQCFAIFYGINVDVKKLEFAPNVFWDIQSSATDPEKKPEIGTIKPEVDYDQVVNLVLTQLQMWLTSKGIKASSVGAADKEAFASGLSKIIDEMDTYEARQAQVSIFQYAEEQLWDLILNYMHPYWIESGQLTDVSPWSVGATVATTFTIQLSMQSRGQVVRDQKEEYTAGFTTKKRALKRINPEMTDSQIEELKSEIESERVVIDGDQTAENNVGNSDGSDAPTA